MVKKAMIMAAGVGSRLDPLTQKVPKPMIPIANKPLMELILEHLMSFGITDVIANTHYLAEIIHEEFDNHEIGLNLNYIHEEQLSGTAGGVKKCEWFFDENETFVVVSGDSLTDAEIDVLIKTHKENGAIATMGLKEVPMEEVSHFGVVVIDDNGRVKEFQEKPAIKDAKSNLVNTGIYVFQADIFKYIPPDTFYDFAKNVFPKLMENNEPLYAHVIKEYWTDIGTINQYKQSSFDVLNNKVNVHDPCSDCSGANTNCLKTSENMNELRIIVGKNTFIDKNVIFEGNCIIGDNCFIEQDVIIKNSIIWDNVVIKKGAKLDDCIVANNVKIGCDSIITPDCIIADSCEVECEQRVLETIKL